MRDIFFITFCIKGSSSWPPFTFLPEHYVLYFIVQNRNSECPHSKLIVHHFWWQFTKSPLFRLRCFWINLIYTCFMHVNVIVFLNIPGGLCCKVQIIKQPPPYSLCMPLYHSFHFSSSVSPSRSCSLPLSSPGGYGCQGRASNSMKGIAAAGYRRLSENNDCTVKVCYTTCMHNMHTIYSGDHHDTAPCHLSSTLGVT